MGTRAGTTNSDYQYQYLCNAGQLLDLAELRPPTPHTIDHSIPTLPPTTGPVPALLLSSPGVAIQANPTPYHSLASSAMGVPPPPPSPSTPPPPPLWEPSPSPDSKEISNSYRLFISADGKLFIH